VKRLISVAVAALLALGLGLTASPAHAQYAPYYYSYGGAYINAWNGGPLIKVYDGVTNNDGWQPIINTYDGDYQFVFEGGGKYQGWCIGDYGNSPSNASAGLVGGCGTNGPGWGSLFHEMDCGDNYVAFYNIHWGGYLDPSGTGNGDQFYLNNSFEDCYYTS
jgi:hypothetical protein